MGSTVSQREGNGGHRGWRDIIQSESMQYKPTGKKKKEAEEEEEEEEAEEEERGTSALVD